MKTFLEYVAEDIINKYGTNLSRTAVVFPNKRAALFLNEHLVRLAGKPIWSPSYITISELFRRHTQLVTGDQIKLICDLYKTYTEVTESDETLDHFYGWGQVMLADFDDIDKNMADAKKVFCNLRDLHELDDVSYLSPEQVETLKLFFSNFSEDKTTELKKRFMKIWSRFGDIYRLYNERLRQVYLRGIQRTAESGATVILKTAENGKGKVLLGFRRLLSRYQDRTRQPIGGGALYQAVSTLLHQRTRHQRCRHIPQLQKSEKNNIRIGNDRRRAGKICGTMAQGGQPHQRRQKNGCGDVRRGFAAECHPLNTRRG